MLIYIVTMGTNNIYNNYEVAFKNYDDAVKFRDYLDEGKGASSNFSTIREMHFF